jgi:hypothetical protein
MPVMEVPLGVTDYVSVTHSVSLSSGRERMQAAHKYVGEQDAHDAAQRALVLVKELQPQQSAPVFRCWVWHPLLVRLLELQAVRTK